MSKPFQIRERYGFVFVQDADGNYLDRFELTGLITWMKQTLNAMRESDISQEELMLRLADSAIDEFIKSSVLRRPVDHQYFVYTGIGVSYRPNTYRRFSGAYILEHADFPGAVKIGFTTDLYARTRQIYFQRGNRPSHVHILFDCENFKELEVALHRKFAHARIDGEWFEKETVLTWLEGVSQ